MCGEVMKIPHPRSSCQKVSELAVKKARESARSFGWSNKTIEALVPLEPEAGRVGIKSRLKFIMHQEKGTKPFLMWWVQGRIIPMGGKGGGKPDFRKGSHVGEPGYVNHPHLGRIWREQRWRHPGIKPKHFMETAIAEAIKESRPEIRQDAIKLLKGQHDNS